MVKICFIHHDGTERSVQAQAGESLMQAAVSNGVPGIDADCGGACACATCHVYVGEQWLDRLPSMEDGEDGMLSVASERKSNSRLACQIEITEALDGLTVSTPEFQF